MLLSFSALKVTVGGRGLSGCACVGGGWLCVSVWGYVHVGVREAVAEWVAEYVGVHMCMSRALTHEAQRAASWSRGSLWPAP